MEQFVVSARKYRPKNFSDVAGQSHVTTTLKNAIRNQQLAHAFLFCGPRGVGKTTCARLLAQAINCLNLNHQPDIEPCHQCASCISFQQNASFNIYELDAASHNSVEDIRSLVDQVRYPPQSGKYKVYIVDEVHMLSTAAFNAFLKTLEEPPSYVIFILATTERHKILPTIISRCQSFDFLRISVNDITQHLISIATQENISYEKEALHVISQKADGSLRDALSIFDLIVTFEAGSPITYQAVIDNLHLLDHDYYFQLTEAFLKRDSSSLLLLCDEILRLGFDGQQLLVGLCEHLRNLMVCQDKATLSLLEVSEEVRERYHTQAEKSKTSFILKALNTLHQAELDYKLSKNKRLHIELSLLKISQQGPVTSSELSSVNAQKKSLKTITPPPPESNKNLLASTKDEAPITQEKIKKIDERNLSTIQAPTTRTPKIPRSLSELKKTSTNITNTASINPVKSQEPAAMNSLSIQQLKSSWTNYINVLKEKKQMSSYSALKNPIILNGDTITITLANSVQKELLKNEKNKLLSFLKDKLGHVLKLEINLNPEQEDTKKPYTNKEKFDYLAQKNPYLIGLQQSLGLEID